MASCLTLWATCFAGVAAAGPASPDGTTVTTGAGSAGAQTTAPVATGNGESAPGAIGTDAAGDDALVLQIAQLTDQIQAAEERIAVDQVHRALDDLELTQAQQELRTEAVDAYVSGGKTALLTFFIPSPVPRYYTDLVLQDQENVVATLHHAQLSADRDEESDQTDLRILDGLDSQLDQDRAALEARAAFDAALQIQEQDAQARAQAIALENEQEQDQIDAAAAGNGSEPSSSALSATESQQQLMSQYPFGPLSASQLGSYGLAETGQTVSGVASWYGPGFDGRPTASGAIYDENGWTCASPNLPFGTMLLVTAGTSSVLVDVNDRGPYVAGRVLDLSHAAAEALGSTGLVNVVAYTVAPT